MKGYEIKHFVLTAFLLMLSHAGLVSNSVLYFPDIMYNLVHKNPEFESNLKWVIQFSVTANLTQDKIHLKLFDLVELRNLYRNASNH